MARGAVGRVVAVVAVAVLAAGCGGGDDGGDDQVAARAAATSTPAAADPLQEYLTAFNAACTRMSGVVTPLQQNAYPGGDRAAEEWLGVQTRAAAARTAFDEAVGALQAPPEAAPVVATWEGFTAWWGELAERVTAAAQGGDDATVTALLAEREAARREARYAAVAEAGLNERCASRY